jgi:acyl-CoA thioesterase
VEVQAVDGRVKQSFVDKVSKEPFAGILNIRLVEVDEGYAVCEMVYSDKFDNIHGMAHGGAIFSLIDEAFEISSNSYGLKAVALNVNVTYLRPATKGNTLRATSSEISRQASTALYQIIVEDSDGVVAVCQALAHRRKEQPA